MVEIKERPVKIGAPEPKKTSRRKFLRNALIGGTALAVGGVGAAAVLGSDESPQRRNPAGRETPSTLPEQLTSQEKQIGKVAESIEATLQMTPEEFTAWANTEHEDGTTNALFYGSASFAFPHVESLSDGGFSTRLTFLDSSRTSFTYAHIPGRIFPSVPHMSLSQWNPEVPYMGMLSFFNGSVTMSLEGEDGGSATVSFGTQIWPDGTKVPFGWVSNLDVPNNPLFGPNQSLLTDQPQPLFSAHKNSVTDYTHRGQTMSREEFLTELEANVGKPIETYLNTDQALRTVLFFDEYGSIGSKDVHIDGLNLFQQFPTYKAIIDGFFNQDSVGFSAAVDQGVHVPLRKTERYGRILPPFFTRDRKSPWI